VRDVVDRRKPNPWTDTDRDQLEALIKEREHKVWLTDMLKRWAQWIAAIALALTVLWDWIGKVIKAFGSHGP
jgi:hypothetical protein